jgi:hypothetical protein
MWSTLRCCPLGGLVASLLGCAPTFAPPVRSATQGAPGRLSQGDIEISGGGAGFVTPAAGGGWLGYGIQDWLAVEAGADGAPGGWGMGFAGIRLTHAPARKNMFHLAFDFESALGVGAGGVRCGNLDPESTSCRGADGRPWYERAAGGGLVGGGAGLHMGPVAAFTRSRVQVTRATAVPTTCWTTVHGGLQLRIAGTVDLFSSVGHTGYWNERDRAHGISLDFGLAIRIPTRPAPTWPRRARRTE